MKSIPIQKTVLVKSPVIQKVRSPVVHTHKSEICHTCKSPIDDATSRFLVVKDGFQNKKILSFHYFFPCWDVDYIFQNLTEYEIFKAGFQCDESILKNPRSVNNLRKNADLWDL